jgi:fructokinase
MPDVVALGELLIDFVPSEAGLGVAGTPVWERAPGGAPANVAVGLARLGVTAAFIGMVGDDPFGHYLAAILHDNAVDIGGLRFSSVARTTLAFVALQPDGARDFVFYRHPGADMLLSPADLDEAMIAAASIFHCGSISVIGEPNRAATYRALAVARQHGRLISIDPNLRLPLWPSAEAARSAIRDLLAHADVIKISADEAEFLTGEPDSALAAAQLWQPNLKLLTITEGGAGCSYVTAGGVGRVPGFAVQPVDTTGAGDSFTAALLASLVATPAPWRDTGLLEAALRRANAAGALATIVRGAIPALPTPGQIETLLAAQPLDT